MTSEQELEKASSQLLSFLSEVDADLRGSTLWCPLRVGGVLWSVSSSHANMVPALSVRCGVL